MSHIAQIASEIRNLIALERAVAALGLTLAGQGKVRSYGGSTQNADRVIHLPGPYDVGFAQNGETYNVIADGECFYDHDNGRNAEVRKALGPKCDHLFEEYNVAILEEQAALNGQTLTKSRLSDGSLEVLLETY